MSSTEEELPEGWSRLESRSKPGRHYYLHRDTGERTWDRPLSHASETSEEPALAAPAPEPSAMEQPPREEPSSAQQQQQQQQQQQRASRRASDFWRSKSDVVHAALLPLPYTTRRSRPLRVVVPRREAHHSAVTPLWCDNTVVTLPLRPTPPGAAAAARGGGSSIENTVCVLSRSWRRFVHREHYSVCVCCHACVRTGAPNHHTNSNPSSLPYVSLRTATTPPCERAHDQRAKTADIVARNPRAMWAAPSDAAASPRYLRSIAASDDSTPHVLAVLTHACLVGG